MASEFVQGVTSVTRLDNPSVSARSTMNLKAPIHFKYCEVVTFCGPDELSASA